MINREKREQNLRMACRLLQCVNRQEKEIKAEAFREHDGFHQLNSNVNSDAGKYCLVG